MIEQLTTMDLVASVFGAVAVLGALTSVWVVLHQNRDPKRLTELETAKLVDNAPYDRLHNAMHRR